MANSTPRRSVARIGVAVLERAYIPACLLSRSYRGHTDWYLLIFYCQPMLPNPLPWHQIVCQRWLPRITNVPPPCPPSFLGPVFAALLIILYYRVIWTRVSRYCCRKWYGEVYLSTVRDEIFLVTRETYSKQFKSIQKDEQVSLSLENWNSLNDTLSEDKICTRKLRNTRVWCYLSWMMGVKFII